MGFFDIFKKSKQNQHTDKLSIEDIHVILANFCGNVYDKFDNIIKSEINSWFKEKRNNYGNEAYQDQLEKNAIYLRELSVNYILTITKFLTNRDSSLIHSNFDNLRGTIQILSKEATNYHLNFLRYDCDGCKYHEEHKSYSILKDLRLSNNHEKYIDELEFFCKFYKSYFLMSQIFLGNILLNNQFAGIAQGKPFDKIKLVVEKTIQNYSNIAIDNIKIGFPN